MFTTHIRLVAMSTQDEHQVCGSIKHERIEPTTQGEWELISFLVPVTLSLEPSTKEDNNHGY